MISFSPTLKRLEKAFGCVQ